MGSDGRIVIRGGLVIDGSGEPGRHHDVAVEGERIVEIGEGLGGSTELDASGMVVAPGFIDIHTHYDAQVFWDQALTPSCFHGVTSVVAGNCGFSIAPCRPEHHELMARTLENVEDMSFTALMEGVAWDFESFPEYLASVERRRPILNFGAYIGHSALRMSVMGDDAYEREATEREVAAMRIVVGEALDAGAMGFSSSFTPAHLGAGGRPVPSRFAATEEFEALASVLGEMGRGVIELAGSPYPEGVYEFQRRNGRPVTYALLAGPSTASALARHGAERAAGSGVWPQVTPRPLVMGMTAVQPYLLNSIDALGALFGRSTTDRLAAYADPAWRASVVAGLRTAAIPIRWEAVAITESASHPELVGRPLDEAAAELGSTPVDVLFGTAVDDRLATRFQILVANGDEDGIAALLGADGVTLGLSDAGAHLSQLCDAPQATDLLGNWVRDRAVLRLERAVRMLTGQQADLFGLAGRGYLRPGGFADLVVFDPATVAPGPLRRVADLPGGGDRLTADQPSGIAHVLVNGTPIISEGTALLDELAARPGHVLGR